jgi:hypothetical protein
MAAIIEITVDIFPSADFYFFGGFKISIHATGEVRI